MGAMQKQNNGLNRVEIFLQNFLAIAKLQEN
jgi:hypothetical protein